MKMSQNLQATFLDETEFPLMSSQVDSHAKTLAQQESKLAWEKGHEAAYGPRLCDLLATLDPNTSSWRTSQTCLLALANNVGDGLAEYSQTWPSAGTMRNGKTYQRQPWALPIAENVSGLLPTPTASDAKGASKNRWLGSPDYRSNLREALRNGPEDAIYPHPDFVAPMMGFPTDWLELKPLETQ